MIDNHRFFWLQGLTKGWALESLASVRAGAYRPFFAHLGAGVRIHDGVTVKYPDRIRLGARTTVTQGCFLNGHGGLTIGRDVMMGAGTKITTSAHSTEDLSIPMFDQPLHGSPVVIGDDVWLGFDVKVLPGVHLGHGSIVGAGAVVTGGDHAPFSVLAGVPARVVGDRRDGVSPDH